MSDTNDEASFEDMLARVALVNRWLTAHEDGALRRALVMGRLLLRLRPLCRPGEWAAALARAGIDPQRAAEFMRAADAPRGGQARWRSVRDALAWVRENPPPDAGPPAGHDARMRWLLARLRTLLTEKAGALGQGDAPAYLALVAGLDDLDAKLREWADAAAEGGDA